MCSSASTTESLSLQLLDAILEKGEAKVSALIETGADVNFTDPVTGDTCLAVAADNLSMVRLLLAHGADPNLQDGAGDSPLFHAIGTGNVEILKALIDSRADVNGLTGMVGGTLLNEAFLENDREALKYLIHRGANPNNRSWVSKENLWDLAKKRGISKQQMSEMIGTDIP